MALVQDRVHKTGVCKTKHDNLYEEMHHWHNTFSGQRPFSACIYHQPICRLLYVMNISFIGAYSSVVNEGSNITAFPAFYWFFVFCVQSKKVMEESDFRRALLLLMTNVTWAKIFPAQMFTKIEHCRLFPTLQYASIAR